MGRKTNHENHARPSGAAEDEATDPEDDDPLRCELKCRKCGQRKWGSEVIAITSYSLITFRQTHMEKGKVMMIRNQESTTRA
jgi:hypothetical protein